MISRRAMIAMLLLLFGVLPVFGQVRILQSNDPPRAKIIAAATEFLSKIANGDSDGAKALFGSDTEQGKLLEVYLDLIRTSMRLERLLPPDPETENVGAVYALRSMIATFDRRIVVVNGNEASISAGSATLDLGMRLAFRDNKWLVTHLVARRAMTPNALEAGRAFVEAIKSFETAFNARKLDQPGDIARIMKQYTEQSWKLSYISPAAMYPPPVAAPVAWKTPSADALAKLPGSAVPSAELGQLIASLPGLPCLSSTSTLISLMDEEAGFSYSGTWKPSHDLQSIELFARGAFGCAQYPGPLPQGLTFSNTRGEVEKRLGPPPISSTDAGLYCAAYPALGLEVTYQKKSGHDPDNTIHHITLTRPDPASNRPSQNAEHASPRFAFRLFAQDMPKRPLLDPLCWGAAALSGVVTLLIGRFFRSKRHARRWWPWLLLAACIVVVVGITATLLRPAPRYQGFMFGDSGIYHDLSSDVILDESSIAKVSPTISSDKAHSLAIGLELTPDGAKTLSRFSAVNIGKRVAIVLDDHILDSLVVRGPLSERIVLDLGTQKSNEEIRVLAGRIHAVVNSIPN